ncbi:MAG: radical SAM protein [Candidatus Bathyarchaeum sp.]|nr:MAG: radical SAM protein [Candidatus Bathyarchaeum sp.]
MNAWPPIGMLYCTEVLMRERIEVSLLDQPAKGFSLNQTLNWVKKEDPDILGLSVLNTAAKEASNVAEEVKRENPNITIVFGNYHPTFNAERILNTYPSVDVIVRGEGEFTSLELARCLEKGGDLEEVRGITFRKNGKVVSTPDRPLIKDVDSLPFPDRNLLEGQYTSSILGVKVATKKFTTLVSSRGCPFSCTFCACRKFARGVWRARSADNIIEELEFLQSVGYEQFLFVDDNFTLDNKRVIELCRKIRKSHMDIEWFCDSRVDHVSYDMFREMVKAGCRCLYFGIESANQRILDYYKKGITPEQAENAVRKARKAGVDVIVGSFIVGAPDETRREIKNTLKFIHKLDIDVPQVNALGVLKGTDVWDDLVARGFVDEDQHWEKTVSVPRVSPLTVPMEEIKLMIYECFREFYLRPKKLLNEILRTIKSPFRMAAVVNNISTYRVWGDTLRRGVGMRAQSRTQKD